MLNLLEISVQVDFDNTVRDTLLKLLLGASGTAVKDQEEGLLLLRSDLLLSVRLVLSEKLRVQLDVAGLVHTVDVSESSGDGEVRRDRGEGSIDLIDILRLSVERVVIDTSVVNTVLLTTGNTNLLHFTLYVSWELSGTYDTREQTISSHCFIGAAL